MDEDPAGTIGVEVEWAPRPNRLRVHAEALEGVPVTAVLVVARSSGRILLVEVAARGWDLPGGHVEDGESVLAAAVRELHEETGLLAVEAELQTLGALHLQVSGELPENYRYPRESQAVAVQVELPGETPTPQVPDEITSARWAEEAEVLELCAGRAWLPLLSQLG